MSRGYGGIPGGVQGVGGWPYDWAYGSVVAYFCQWYQ